MKAALGLYRGSLADAVKILNRGTVGSVDTAFNYQNGSTHRALAANVRPQVGLLHISTKVGYFDQTSREQGSTSHHSIDERLLLEAAAVINSDLGTVPDVIFIHNPEEAHLSGQMSLEDLHKKIARVGMALIKEGLAKEWGVATWVGLQHGIRMDTVTAHCEKSTLAPGHLMLPLGLGWLRSVRALLEADLHGTCSPFASCTIHASSPFTGGILCDSRDLTAVNRALNLAPDHAITRTSLSLIAALPRVKRVCFSTTNNEHARENVEALSQPLSRPMVERLLTAVK